MWPNNGFGNNGHFPPNYNQEDFTQPPFGGDQGQRFFTPQPNMMQFDEMNGDSYMANGNFQPEVGLFNDGAFIPNQFVNQFSPTNFHQPPVPSSNTPRPPTQINARAAELKAELLKRREGRTSSVPPSTTMAGTPIKPIIRPEPSSSMHNSPMTPTTAEERREQELNVNELISQYSDIKPTADASVKQEKLPSNPTVANATPIQKYESAGTPRAKSPTGVVLALLSNGKGSANQTNGKVTANRHTSNGSEVSEGEILEDAAPERSKPASEPQEMQLTLKANKNEEQPPRNPREDQIAKLPQPRALRDEPPQRPQQLNIKAIQNREHEEPETRPRPSEYPYERRFHTEPERQPHSRRDLRDSDYRRSEPQGEQSRTDTSRPAREQRLPTLDDLLPHDENLREWLEITGYHNAPYRDKILNRRRAIAALDAKREQLLKEMHAEERGPPNSTPSSTMLPPPLPNKAGGQDSSPIPPQTTDVPPDRAGSNKRPYSDVQSPREDTITGKIARTDDRSRGPRAKEEEDVDRRRPRSGGFDSDRRPPADRRDRSPRNDSRGRSRERDISPGRRAYESRPAARNRSYEPDIFRDRDEAPDRGPRPYVERGNYRGRGYDPNYRGRGARGRGRGDPRDMRDSRENDSPYGSRIANSRPYKDIKGFDKGGKGDTRYFIVKSFNEDNVLRCISDSIWTTQVQNGSLFKEAFETCKNVILVFSINRSRAFQGYARMESLPGSVTVPDWQKAINWESAGAFKVRWLVMCSTRFHTVGHLKNAYNENQAVLIGKDGQEIEERCAEGLIKIIDEEAIHCIEREKRYGDEMEWGRERDDNDYYP